MVRQCRTISKREIKLAKTLEVGQAKAPAVFELQVAAKAGQQLAAILGSGLALLFKLDNVVADIPVGGNQAGVNGFNRCAWSWA